MKVQTKRQVRHKRIRAKIKGTKEIPRLSVYRSRKHLFLQLIDDKKNETLVGLSDKVLKIKKKTTKSELAHEAGKLLAKTALEMGIKKAVFDRGGYLYKGRIVKAAEGARAGGLKF
ncbi:50S ribosomal protein L18 [Candidatus Giovannonibacteria bacterium]|nr:50S ribosomal protein L18 [Candidatus Giovannonibacteria bacterium]